MKLSELHSGEKAVIVKVYGHGGFRKRIVEMGFIKGKEVTVLENAPLHDPVRYLIMGYEVSLRHDEAARIQCVTIGEARNTMPQTQTYGTGGITADDRDDEGLMHGYALRRRHHINVALVGNPNCGKTSLFNYASGAHERVGNYSGVTIQAAEAKACYEDYEIHLVDLPGTYSLSAYSGEEIYVRRQLIDKTPDVVLNVIDASNLERNLYLTTQLIDMHIRMVCALNMYDETERRGDTLDYKKLGRLLAVPMVPTVFKTGRGVNELFHTVIELYEGRISEGHIHVNHGPYIEEGIDSLRKILRRDSSVIQRYTPRFLALKILEGDRQALDFAGTLPEAEEIVHARDIAARKIEAELKCDPETAIMDAKYGFVNGALQEAEFGIGEKEDTYHVTHLIDHVITHRYMGLPVFVLMIYAMFWTTFTVGGYPMGWIEDGVSLLGDMLTAVLPDGPVKDMLIDGVLGGVGSVIVFLPQILILYAFISFMEDSGYMSRAAFIMDRLMHKMGLHGKSFIPLIMGFGCNVPAIMATRTVESRRSRLITMLILPFMSCSARLPLYIIMAGTFFAPEYHTPILVSLYAVGILMAVIMSVLFSRFLVRGEDTPFVMELPPYRFPSWKSMARHTWEKGREYLKKMGGIILVASIIVWALGYFPHDPALSPREQKEQSFIGHIGKAIEPLFLAQGFNWKLDISLLSGIGAKEITASTLGVLYTHDVQPGETSSPSAASGASGAVGEKPRGHTDGSKYELLRREMEADGLTPLTALAFMIFTLLYFPCIATIAAIRNEAGSWRWGLFAAIYTTALAWICSAAVYQLGTIFM
ncbi:MAG: ferrous iron transport protein B [Prevotella sp.]